MKKAVTSGLSSLHERLITIFSKYSEEELRIQYHPDLSQLGWHLAHIAFTEQYWLREIVLGDNSKTAGLHQSYFPEMIEKNNRGALPGITDFEQIHSGFSEVEILSSELSMEQHKHPLLKDDYIGWFLLQHGQQHLETMQMALHQKALRSGNETDRTARPFEAKEPALPEKSFNRGNYEIGASNVLARDNEQPLHEVKLSSYKISEKPVTNAEYLGFMQADGYKQERFWNRAGWQWMSDSNCCGPEYWLPDAEGSWQVMVVEEWADIDPDSAVSGLSWYEADAFARYANCRLPHEHEWEAAVKADSDLRRSVGSAWEWCANTFFPYHDFTAFPYERYSTPWFNNDHYLLKGSSPFSGETVCNPSFRNFYQPEKRHVFAGVRLASDA